MIKRIYAQGRRRWRWEGTCDKCNYHSPNQIYDGGWGKHGEEDVKRLLRNDGWCIRKSHLCSECHRNLIDNSINPHLCEGRLDEDGNWTKKAREEDD